MNYQELEAVAKRRYNGMRKRFQAKYTRDGRLVRPNLVVPFSLEEFVCWLREVFGDNTTTRCVYCRWPLTLHTMHLDHRIPVVQGGSLNLSNLAVCCAACNLEKGELTEGAFLELRALITNDPKFRGVCSFQFTEHDCSDVRKRLQSQLKLAIREQKRQRQTSVRVIPHQRGRSA